MQQRLHYANTRLSMAIERFLAAKERDERVLAARWVTAWSMLTERLSERVRTERDKQHASAG